MTDFNQSLQEAVCIDDEIFFGPVTEKEKKIKEQFERFGKSDRKAGSEAFKAGENEISMNDSLYKSFSVDNSKYDSFDDSLNDEIDEKPQKTKHVTLRKNFDRLKSKRYAFYDSLEDVCSLVSHVDKCSISCENENENVIEKQKIIEDSLKNQPIISANKIHGVNEQINFDEDSLAIIELENTFDDSLEECNLLSSIEIEEVSDIDNVVAENPDIHVEQKPLCVSRNLFDTSVEVCERKSMIDTVEKESHDNKNIMFDSLSSSDFKDILRDSLEESENLNSQLNFNVASKFSNINNIDQKHVCVSENLDTSVQIISEKKNNIVYRVYKEEFCDNKNRLSDSLSSSDYKDIMKDSLEESENYNGRLNFRAPENVVSVVNLNDICASGNRFDTSVQIICEKMNVIGTEDKQNFCNDKNRLFDSLSNSAHDDFSKDSVEEAKDNSKPSFIKPNIDALDAQEPKHIPSLEKDILDTSVQVICEKINLPHEKNISVSKCNDILKVRLENFTNVDSHLHEQMVAKTANNNVIEKIICSDSIDNEISNQITTPSAVLCSDKYSNDSNKHSLYIVSNENEKCLKGENRSVVSDEKIPVSVADNVSLKNEIITVDSCHLQLLNDNLNLDKDLKFQLHIEVTVGDKKCQIASQDIKLLPVKNLNSEKCKSNFSPLSCNSNLASIAHDNDNTGRNATAVLEDDFRKSKSNIKKQVVSGKNSFSRESANNTGRKSKNIKDVSITQRIKRDLAKSSDNVEEQNNTRKINDVSLLQALDLHDISMSFLNESVIQSEDSIMPLNLCSRDCGVQNIHTSAFKKECKENVPGSCISPSQYFGKKNFNSKSNKTSPNKFNHNNKTPKKLKNSPSFKEMAKKTPGTKIPVRMIDNFTVPIPSVYKVKQTPPAASSEKGKKCLQTPHSSDSGKKTPGATPKKTHFCKVRNTIFSKVPQITPSKKFKNIESPVAKYIRNAQDCGTVKTPVLEPVLRDCMNKLHIHQQYEFPHHGNEFHSPKDSTLKQTKRKA